MKGIKILGLCLVAMLVTSAVAVSSAVAAGPEYYECAKKTGGKFEKGCGKEGGKGGYERTAVKTPSKYTGTNGKSVLTVFVPGIGIVGDTSCAKAKDTGSIISPTQTETTVTFEKCESEGKKCTSVGEKTKGDIKTNTLEGTLVEAPESKTGIGVTITAKSAENSAEFECEGLKIKTKGAVTGEVTGNTTKASKTSKNVFEVNEGGEPTIQTEGSEFTLLTTITDAEGTNTIPSGESTTAALKGAEIGVS
jgi:hypothetical protein